MACRIFLSCSEFGSWYSDCIPLRPGNFARQLRRVVDNGLGSKAVIVAPNTGKEK